MEFFQKERMRLIFRSFQKMKKIHICYLKVTIFKIYFIEHLKKFHKTFK
jgi:hypothetical protein